MEVSMTTIFLYILVLILLLISFAKDKEKTKLALKKSWRSFENILPQFLGIIFIVGLTLSILKPEVISKFIGKASGIVGIISSAIIGSITIMPTFVAFDTGNMLLKSGAGYAQVGALISSLTLVGILTLSLESKYIGKKAAFLRNFIAFIFSIIVGFIIGEVM
jgi:uncharacterized membrane protein YraQ (UPF0718 family)